MHGSRVPANLPAASRKHSTWFLPKLLQLLVGESFLWPRPALICSHHHYAAHIIGVHSWTVSEAIPQHVFVVRKYMKNDMRRRGSVIPARQLQLFANLRLPSPQHCSTSHQVNLPENTRSWICNYKAIVHRFDITIYNYPLYLLCFRNAAQFGEHGWTWQGPEAKFGTPT